MLENNFDVIIIGAGAAGLLSAISACNCNNRVLVVEKNRRAARKMMITGKGRCNFSNSADIKDYLNNIFPEPRFLYPAFKAFFTNDIINLLEKAGVEVKLERGGRYFPMSDKAVDVVDALVKTATKAGAIFRFDTQATKILTKDSDVVGVEVTDLESTKCFFAPKVIICTGGASYAFTGSNGDGYELAKKCGHSLTPILPALAAVVTKTKIHTKTLNLNLKNVAANLYVDGEKTCNEFGELLFTEDGISGPIVLTLSRWISIALHENKQVRLAIDLKSALDEKTLDLRLIRELNSNGNLCFKSLLKQWLPIQMLDWFIERVKIDADKLANQINSMERKRIIALLKHFPLDIERVADLDEAIVTCGGVSLKEINPKTMESKLVKGLFFAGEVVDIDANTGGYNLQSAFSMGWLAGKNNI